MGKNERVERSLSHFLKLVKKKKKKRKVVQRYGSLVRGCKEQISETGKQNLISDQFLLSVLYVYVSLLWFISCWF